MPHLLAACVVAGTAVSANAAATKSGNTTLAIAAVTRGSATAFDDVNKVYLVVGAAGIVRGRFVGADGTPLGATFQIQVSANYTHFPRVAYSPDADGGAGAFLVTWHESDLAGGATSVHARLVSYTKGGAFGTDAQIATDGSWWEAGPAVAYSTVSKEFLVVWRSLTRNDILGARVSNSAQLLGSVRVTATVDGERDPSIAYNPTTDEFLVGYSGYNNVYAFVACRRVKAVTGAVTERVDIIQTSGTYITDTSYNPVTNKYLVSWFSLPGGASFGRLVNADGTVSGDVITLSTRWKAYDGLSVGYNRKSDTFFLVSHSSAAKPYDVEDGGVEIKSAGTPVDNGFIVTNAGGTGNFYPRLSASTDQPDWLISTANGFTSTLVQRIAGTNSDGTTPTPTPTPTPAPAPTPTPVTPVPNPLMSVDVPSASSTVTGTMTVAGWAVDFGASSGSGIDAVHVWAYPNPGSGAAAVFVGAAAVGGARPDVGLVYGSQFSTSGYYMTAKMTPGTYDLCVFAHSTVSGTFNNWKVVRITVVGPTSIPRMAIDLPSANQTVSQNITVAGWALDLGSSAGTGIDAIHVWAYPAAGGTPVFVGVASLGVLRPDVGAAYGNTRFNTGGFALTGTIAAGDYNLAVFAHSTVTGTFNNVALVRIQVR